jgi:pSer/pThr/pTyr-binding forkhead associated (FHA) protein
MVEDLNSTNGTFVNGERLSGSRPLHPGDVVTIGQTQLTYEAPS